MYTSLCFFTFEECCNAGYSGVRMCGSGSVPKCHGSGTLVGRGVPMILPGGMHIFGWPPPGSGSGSASKQCGSTAQGSTVKRLLSNLQLCLGKHCLIFSHNQPFRLGTGGDAHGRGGMHRGGGGGGMHVHPVHPPGCAPADWYLPGTPFYLWVAHTGSKSAISLRREYRFIWWLHRKAGWLFLCYRQSSFYPTMSLPKK